MKLIELFRKRAPPDVSERVTDKAMEQIFDKCWKTQREQRKNRSFIRKFWRYQDQVGPDNYPTFVVQVDNNRITTRRGNIR
jgi:hypothetical protein